MAQWIEATKQEFDDFVEQQEALHHVRAEVITKGFTVFYTGGESYRDSRSNWIAKRVRDNDHTRYYITNTTTTQ